MPDRCKAEEHSGIGFFTFLTILVILFQTCDVAEQKDVRRLQVQVELLTKEVGKLKDQGELDGY